MPAVTAGVEVSKARKRHDAPLPGRNPGVGVADPFQTDIEVALGEAFGQPFAPLHDHHRVFKIGVEIQGIKFTERSAP